MNFNTIKHNILPILSLAMVSFLWSCSAEPTVENKEEHGHEHNEQLIELTKAQYAQANIVLDTLSYRELGTELSVNGTIELPPQGNISISMPYGGFLKYTEMLPGTSVKKGQLLAVIENPEFIRFQQDFLESSANSVYLKAEYERQNTLVQENVGTGKKLEKAKSDYLSNEARLQALEAQLKMIGLDINRVKSGKISSTVNLYAPVSGSVRDVLSNVGRYVQPQDVIMNITNSDDLHVELTVYENDIYKVKKGQRIRFRAAQENGDDYYAKVFLVGSSIREDRSVTVHGHLEEKHEQLLPGMYVKAQIETGAHKVLAIASQAIVRFNSKHYVFAYRGEEMEDGATISNFEMLEVEPGISEGDYTEITFVDPKVKFEHLKFATEGSFTLLATAKNVDDGGGHGH